MGRLQGGTVLHGRYAIITEVGHGAMAVVYSADDKQTGKRVAIKQMEMFVDNDDDKKLAIQQFEHEAQLLHSLQHPNIPRVYEWFEDGAERYLVMDFIEGEVLSRYADISDKPQAPPPRFLPQPIQVVDWALQIANALMYLHAYKPKPIIYKDLKPDNLMLGKDGRINMLDFGIAKGRDEKGQYKTIIKGMVTPGYAAPEQYSGVATDPRTDLYGLGATMYALLTGRVPPQAVDRHEATYNRQRDPLRPVREHNPDVSQQLEYLVMKLLILKREQRPHSAEQVVRELQALPEAQAVQKLNDAAARPSGGGVSVIWWAAVVILAVAMAGFGTWWFLSGGATPAKPKPKHSFVPCPLRVASGSDRSTLDPTADGWRSARQA